MSRRAKPPTGSRTPVVRFESEGSQPHWFPGEPRYWYVQTFTGEQPDPPEHCTWYASRAEARSAAAQLGGQRKAGRPRRAGAQPITKVDVLFGESELAEVDSARAEVPRQRWIRDAALEKARRGR